MEELGRALSEAASVASGSAKETRKKHTETGGKSVSVTAKTTQVDASVLGKIFNVFEIAYFYIWNMPEHILFFHYWFMLEALGKDDLIPLLTTTTTPIVDPDYTGYGEIPM